jgi:TPR repeat protein
VQAPPPALEKSAVDKLALALRDVQPSAAPAVSGPARGLTLTPTSVDFTTPSDVARRFRAQGLVALAGGDVAAARAFLERAADAGDARALLVLGDAYDPATLTRLGALGLKGDPSRARDYYQQANDAGLAAAHQRIAAYEVSQ